jgi:hypothetical protein
MKPEILEKKEREREREKAGGLAGKEIYTYTPRMDI